MTSKTTAQAFAIRLSILNPETGLFFPFDGNCFEIQAIQPDENEEGQILEALYERVVPEVRDLVVRAFTQGLYVTYAGEDIFYKPDMTDVTTHVSEVEPEEDTVGVTVPSSVTFEPLVTSEPTASPQINPHCPEPQDEVLKVLETLKNNEDSFERYHSLKTRVREKAEEIHRLTLELDEMEKELDSFEPLQKVSSYLESYPSVVKMLQALL